MHGFRRIVDRESISRLVFPIRVIDVAATLDSRGGICFTAPREWNFHVISHTWTLEVREFSAEIGRFISESGRSGDSSAYNEAFQDTDFSRNECYRQLIDFLGLLRRDGVKAVWLDTLCINQMNKEERSREIAHMGAYYTNSVGCIALAHGIGGGYKIGDILRTQHNVSQGSLPRYFRRAWTFQEFVLPRKLRFLVGGLSAALRAHINSLIKHWKSPAGLCECCIFKYRFDKSTVRMHVLEAKEGREEEIVETTEKCKECESLALVRKAGELERTPGETIYFVDRAAYNFLTKAWFRFEEEALIIDGRNQQQKSHWDRFHQEKEEEILDELYSLFDECLQPVEIARQIAKRDCSYEEDRILCILGLLGMDGIDQIRAEQTLEDQMVEVGSRNHDLLATLCVLDRKGHGRVGMSWVPDLRDPESKFVPRSGKPSPLYTRDLQISKVCPQGIVLVGKVAHARVLPAASHYGKPVHLMLLPDQPPLFVTPTIDKNSVMLSLWKNRPSHRGKHAVEDHVGELTFVLPDCHPLLISGSFELEDVWMILVGDVQVNEEMHKMGMACVGKDAGSLHKVGVVCLPWEYGHAIFELGGETCECVVGGQGEYVAEYLTLVDVHKEFVHEMDNFIWDEDDEKERERGRATANDGWNPYYEPVIGNASASSFTFT